MIFEPIQGVGGINPVPDNYLPHVVDLIRNKHKGLIIADEVQTGFGRVGTSYWGHRWKGIKPDIVTMAKGIGNGFPMGAVVTRKEITDAVKAIYFNTFGGGHIQCRLGIDVLDIIKKEKLPENSEKVGSYLISELTKLSKKYPIIGNVRGHGLMIGIELVENPETKVPAAQKAGQLMELTRERGLLMGKAGAFGNVIRLQPPLCITMEDAKYTIEAFEDALINLK